MDWKTLDSLSLRIAVLAGGDSAEREISLASGANVLAALREAGHQPTLIDPVHVDLATCSWRQFDACFLALHGGAGEDGRIQRRLELLKVAYTGSGPEASRLAMSKSASKERFRQAGVPTADYLLLEATASAEPIGNRLHAFDLPLVVKPDGQGSSLGVSIIHNGSELSPAIRDAGRFDDYVIVEPWIAGREFTVTMLDEEPLPMIEVVSSRKFFDYDAKYRADDTQYDCDPELSASARQRIETAARGAARALGTRGLSRVDLILDRANQPWVLEVNTIPGLTDHSLAPRAAARAGISLPALCDRLIRDCLQLELAR